MAAKKATGKTHGNLKDTAQRIWLAGLGAWATAEQEGGKLFDQLVHKGQDYQGDLRAPVDRAAKSVAGGMREIGDRARRTFKSVEDVVDARVGSALSRLGVPTRREIAELSRRVQVLTERLGGPAAGKPRRRSAK